MRYSLIIIQVFQIAKQVCLLFAAFLCVIYMLSLCQTHILDFYTDFSINETMCTAERLFSRVYFICSVKGQLAAVALAHNHTDAIPECFNCDNFFCWERTKGDKSEVCVGIKETCSQGVIHTHSGRFSLRVHEEQRVQLLNLWPLPLSLRCSRSGFTWFVTCQELDE